MADEVKINKRKREMGSWLEDIKCPKCKAKGKEKEGIRVMGRKNEKIFLQCQSCFLEAYVNPDNVEFNYSTKEKKDK